MHISIKPAADRALLQDHMRKVIAFIEDKIEEELEERNICILSATLLENFDFEHYNISAVFAEIKRQYEKEGYKVEYDVDYLRFNLGRALLITW
jgi:hypothetical protein